MYEFLYRLTGCPPDPALDLQGGTILFVLSLLAGPTAGFLIIFKPSVDQKYQAFANTALFFIMPILTIQMVELLMKISSGGFLFRHF